MDKTGWKAGKPVTCGQSFEIHSGALLSAMAAVGFGSCWDSYRVLVELADAMRRSYDWPSYAPEGLVPSLQELSAQEAARSN